MMNKITAFAILVGIAITLDFQSVSTAGNKQPLKYNYEFKICPDRPAMKFRLTWDDKNGDIIIIFFDKRTGGLIQKITAEGVEEPYQGPWVLSTEDINFDGCQDLKLLCFTGATGNQIYRYWTYNRKKKKFLFEKSLEDICNPQVIATDEIFSHCKQGGAGAYYTEQTYKRIGNGYVVIKETDQYSDPVDGRLIREEKELRNGEMTTIKKDFVKDED